MEPILTVRMVRRMGAALLLLPLVFPAQAQTHWDFAVSTMSDYKTADMMHPAPEDMKSSNSGWSGRAECAYRPANWGSLVVAFDRAITQHGWAENERHVSTTTVNNWFLGPINTITREADLLTIEHTISTVSLLHRMAIRPYADRRAIGFALLGAWGLRVHHVVAESGVIANEQYQQTDNLLFEAFTNGFTPSSLAMSQWNERQVAHRANAMGVSIALELRAELYFTRYASLFIDAAFTLPIAEPRFAAYAVAEEAIVRPAYEVRLYGVRSAAGVAVHF